MINYKVLGEQNEHTLVLLSGLGTSIKMWEPQEELADTYKLVMFDYVGDTNDEIEITMESIAKYIIDTLRKLNIHEYSVAGLSLGGLLAQEVYRQEPNSIKSLVLSNTYSYVPDIFLKVEVENRKNRLDSMTDEEYIQAITKKCTLTMDISILNIIEQTFKINRSTYIHCASAPIGHDFRDVIRNISVPTLVLGSSFDIVTPIFLQYLQYLVIPGAKYKQFHSGHLPNIECAAEYNQEVRKFLDGIYR